MPASVPFSASQPPSCAPSPTSSSCLMAPSRTRPPPPLHSPASRVCFMPWKGSFSGYYSWMRPLSILLPFMAYSSCWRHLWPASSSPSSATPTCTSTSQPWCGAWPCTLLHTGGCGHAAEAGQIREHTTHLLPSLPVGADRALCPSLCQCPGPLTTLPVQ